LCNSINKHAFSLIHFSNKPFLGFCHSFWGKFTKKRHVLNIVNNIFCNFDVQINNQGEQPMKVNESTIQQIDYVLKKVAAKFPVGQEATQLTDIHLQVKQDSGELCAFDDDDKELARTVIEEWIDNKDEDFYESAKEIIKQRIHAMRDVVDNLSILKPYTFVLTDDDKENVTDLYLVDDDTVILDEELMKGLDKELDDFLKDLLSK
jgi:uncharacterized protein YicC (UPF0701 family)